MTSNTLCKSSLNFRQKDKWWNIFYRIILVTSAKVTYPLKKQLHILQITSFCMNTYLQECEKLSLKPDQQPISAQQTCSHLCIRFLFTDQQPATHWTYLQTLGDTTITCVLVWSKSDQRRLRKTLHKQTDKQTDTTKIMVTWPWTNTAIHTVHTLFVWQASFGFFLWCHMGAPEGRGHLATEKFCTISSQDRVQTS